MNKSVDPNTLNASKIRASRSSPKISGMKKPDQQKLDKEKERLSENVRRLEAIIQFDAHARICNSLQELLYHAVNTTGDQIGARQVMVLEKQKSFKVRAISGIASIEGKSSTVLWLEQEFSRIWLQKPSGEKSAHGQLHTRQAPARTWALPNVLLSGASSEDGTNFLLAYLSDKPFPQNSNPLAEHYINSISHCARQYVSNRARLGRWLNQKTAAAITLLVAAAMFIPVPLIVLAPVEVVARDPVVVAAPLAGVIEKIFVKPNTKVTTGQLLARYDARELENNLTYAQRQYQVANSRLHSASQNAFGAGQGKRELAQLKSEADLARTKVIFARAELETSEIHASVDGVALLSSSEDWTGKPVATGERLLKIANPDQSKFALHLSAADASLLHTAKRARIFLNSAPLTAISASITTRSYDATITHSGVLAYELTGLAIKSDDVPLPKIRIGERGTAQVIGPKVTLGYFLFRRPLSALRRYFVF